jgi:hypothetical protein
LHTELECGGIAGGGLLACSGPGDGVADASEQIDFIGKNPADAEIVVRIGQIR